MHRDLREKEPEPTREMEPPYRAMIVSSRLSIAAGSVSAPPGAGAHRFHGFAMTTGKNAYPPLQLFPPRSVAP